MSGTRTVKVEGRGKYLIANTVNLLGAEESRASFPPQSNARIFVLYAIPPSGYIYVNVASSKI